jgi:hypothetical protein
MGKGLVGRAVVSLGLLWLAAAPVFAQSTASFGAATLYDNGADATGLAVADVNKDGHLDLIVAACDSGIVRVRLGAGDGTFGAPADYPAGPAGATSLFALAVADFNGDTWPDVATGNVLDDTVVILLNNGAGLFGAPTTFPVGSSPHSIVAADLNGDSHPDLAIANIGSSDVSILLGDGLGAFGAAAGSPHATGLSPYSIRAGDLNGDNHIDLVISNVDAETLTILLGGGDGSFTAAPDIDVGTAPVDVAIVDFNGNGVPDLVVVAAALGELLLYTGAGDGTFSPVAPSTPLTTGSLPNAIRSGDFNGDGILDLAVVNQFDDTVTIFQGNGTDFTTGDSFATEASAVPALLDAGDFNEDTRLDLAVGHAFSDNSAILLNDTCCLVTVTRTGTGSGTVTSVSPGINCGPTCSHVFPEADPIELTATPTAGSLFAGWSGACTGTGSCILPAGADASVTATFDVLALNPGFSGGAVGVLYDQFATTTNGTPPFTFTLQSGTLPPGLTLADDGQIVGTPFQAGTFNFVLAATDSSVPPAAGSRAFSITIAAGTTTTSTPDVAMNYSDAPQPIGLTAAVVNPAEVNSGTVTFTVRDGSSSIIGAPVTSGTLADGIASAVFTLPGGTPPQTLAITAVYSGSPDYLTSTATSTLVVDLGLSTTTAANATAVFNTVDQAVTLSVTVTSPGSTIDAGNVTFTVRDFGSNIIGVPVTSATVTDGIAAAVYTLPGGTPPQTLTITADYSGSANFGPSSDSTHSIVVDKASSTTIVSNTTRSYSLSPQNIFLSAGVLSPSGPVTVGTVTFTLRDVGNAIVGAPVIGAVSNGVVFVPYTIPGGTIAQTLQMTAVYSGAPPGIADSSDTTHTLTISPATTTTVPAGASVGSSSVPQTVPLSATITSGAGTVGAGTVIFSVRTAANVVVGSNVTVPVVSGTANASYTLPGGTTPQALTIFASYGGTPNLAGSVGSATLDVTCPGTIAIGPSTMPPVRLGQPFSMTLTAPGLGGVIFSLTGALPPGLTQSGATISGTPASLGRFDVNVTATSTAGSCSGSGAFTFRVMRPPVFAVGPGGASTPTVRGFDDLGTMTHNFLADDPAFAGGVRVAVADINGDGIVDIITAPGPGAAAATVRVFDGATNAMIRQFTAYPFPPAGGMYVAAGDVNGDGVPDIITGRDGATGEVRVFDGQTSALLSVFLAYPIGVNGVRVAAGDVDADGIAEIVTAPPFGFVPEVRVFDASGTMRQSFMAYTPAFIAGVYVAAGDIDGDGRADIVTGADAGGGPHVIAFSGADGHVLRSFFAYDPAFPGGVRVAAGDLNLDGHAEIITGAGPGGGPHVRVFDGVTGAEVVGMFAYTSSYPGGVYVAAPIAQSRVAIDTLTPGASVPSTFTIAGWAALAGAITDSGVDTIHVWAVPVGGGAPLFLGVTNTDVPRPDLAAVLGGAYADAGYTLTAGPLPPGMYDVAVFAHSARSGTFIAWRIVRVTVTP